MKENINKILSTLSNYEFYYENEKDLQNTIEEILLDNQIKIKREYNLFPHGEVDFFHEKIAYEVKIKGNKKSIYRQCRDYCNHDDVDALVLITSVSMSLPEYINEKPCFVYNLNTRKY